MLLNTELSSSKITDMLKLKNRTSVLDHHITPLMESGIIEWVYKDKKQSRLQKYKLTEEGERLAREIEKENESSKEINKGRFTHQGNISRKREKSIGKFLI